MPKIPPSEVGAKIRAAAAVYGTEGQSDRAKGLLQAADIADKLLMGAHGLVEDVTRVLAEQGRKASESFGHHPIDSLLQRVTKLEGLVAALQETSMIATAAAVHVRTPPPKARRLLDGLDRMPAGQPAVRALGPGVFTTLAAISHLDNGEGLHVDTLVAVTGSAHRTIHNHLVRLRSENLVETVAGHHVATAEGIAKAVAHPMIPVGDELLSKWLEDLPEGEAKTLDFVAERGEVFVRDIDVGAADRTIHNHVVALVGKCLLTRPSHGKVALAPILRPRG